MKTITERHSDFLADQPPTASAFLAWCDKYRWWLGAAVLLLYLAGFSGQWRPGPDAAVYLTVGRNVAEGIGFSHPNGLEHNFPPGIVYLIAAAFRIGGPHGMAVLHGLLLAATFTTLLLSFVLMRLVAGRPAAVAATLLLAVNTCFYSRAYFVLAEVPFQVGVMASLLGFEVLCCGRRRLAGMALLLAGVVLMASFRSVYIIIVAGIMLAAFVEGVRRFGTVKIFSAAIAAFLGFIILRSFDPGLDGPFSLSIDEKIIFHRLVLTLPETLHVAATENLWELLSASTSEASFGVDFGPILNFPLGLAVLTIGFMLYKLRRIWGILIALFVLQWLTFMVTVRYHFTIMPFLALGWLCATCWAERRVGIKHGGWVFTSLIVLWMAPNLIRTLDITIEQRQPNMLDHYNDGKYAQIDAMAKRVQALTPHDAVLLSELRIIQPLSYLSRRRGLEMALAPWENIGELPLYAIVDADSDPSAIIKDKGWRIHELIISIPAGKDDSEDVLMLWSLSRQ